MRIHSLQHVPFEGLACIESWIAERGHAASATRLFAGEPLPPVDAFEWLFVMGGPMSVGDESQFPWLVDEKRFLREAVEAGKTIVGVCLGAQLLAEVLGARVYRGAHAEIGWFPVQRVATHPLLADWPDSVEAFHWHGDTFDIPQGAVHLLRSEACENQAFLSEGRLLGLQFHMEMTDSSARTLIGNCGEEIVDGPFIQTPGEMLAQPERFVAANRLMCGLLDELAQT